MRAFSLGSFALLPTVGKWSRIATFGSKVKEGAEMVFNTATLGQMVDNWQHRGMRLPMCLDHESATGGRAPAAAYFDALALFDAGQLVKFASMSDAVAPDALDGNGEPRNGLYARLSAVTPLGADPKEGLANYGYISPYFTEAGAREDGTPIGYELFDVAAVNVPFQSGCEIAFQRRVLSFNPGSLHEAAAEEKPGARRATGAPMNPELMKKYGLTDGYSQDDLQAAMQKMAEDCDTKDAAMKKFAEDKPDDKDDEDKKEMSALAEEVGLSKDTRLSQILTVFKATRAPMSEMQALRKENTDLREAAAARAMSQRQFDATALVDGAIDGGRIAKEQRDGMIKFAMADLETAKGVLEKLPVAFATATNVMQRFTANGKPLDGGATGPSLAGQTFAQLGGMQVAVKGGRFAEKAQAYAKQHGVKLADAQRAVLKADPTLATDL